MDDYCAARSGITPPLPWPTFPPPFSLRESPQPMLNIPETSLPTRHAYPDRNPLNAMESRHGARSQRFPEASPRQLCDERAGHGARRRATGLVLRRPMADFLAAVDT